MKADFLKNKADIFFEGDSEQIQKSILINTKRKKRKVLLKDKIEI
jgi:hypothetical protein